MLRITFLFSLVLFSLGAYSQNIIKGKVLDSLTKEPIPYVNVYLANTTIGTVTNATGEFIIKGFPTGKYNVTASFVGYNTWQKSIDFSNNEIQVTIHLAEQTIRLEEVSVKADSSNRDRYLKFFEENFLGRTKNASQMVLLNPKNLRLFYDQDDSVFVAYAKAPIEIENRALGYKIFYQLDKFQVDFKTNKMDYRGIPRFEPLDPKGPRELKRWESERKRAYYGSFTHFLKALRENSFEANGFAVHTVTRHPNKNRPSDGFLIDRINHFQKRLMVVKGTTQNRTGIIDSLNYYTQKYRLPTVVDSIGRRITESFELLVPGKNDLIGYKGFLEVIYTKEAEENNYTVDKPPLKIQTSIIHFLGTKKIKIYENGYYEDVSDIFFDGYMGWSEKLAELLPQEYVPVESDVKK